MARTRDSAFAERVAKATPQMPHTLYFISGVEKNAAPARQACSRKWNLGIRNR